MTKKQRNSSLIAIIIGGVITFSGIVASFEVTTIIVGLIVLGVSLLFRLVIWPGKQRKEEAERGRLRAEWEATFGTMEINVVSNKAHQSELKRLYKVQETPDKLISDEITFGCYGPGDKKHFSVIIGTARIGDVDPEQEAEFGAVFNRLTSKDITIDTKIDETTGDIIYVGTVDVTYRR